MTDIRMSSMAGIPFGNNAGRPTATTGQPYFNGETQRLELYTSGGSWENIVQEVPGVSSITGGYSQVTGSGVINIYGTNFVDGAIAAAIGTNGVLVNATSTTFNSLVQLTATFTGLSDAYEPYDIKVTNPSNLFGMLPDALIVNNNLSWTTSAGSLGTFDEQVSISVSAVATDPESQAITYSLASGSSLPSGVTLNSSTGAITGTLPDIASSTTYTFTINASDGVNPAVARTFSITSQILGPATLDLLIVAGGGGGGGGYYGGGGGAGGVRQLTGISRTSSQCILTIGNGGAGGAFGTKGSSGQNSSLAIMSGTTYSATGGGGGAGTTGNGGSSGQQATSGGSGGGGSLYTDFMNGASGNAGGYSPVEGYAGGTGSGYQSNTSSNGGGAGGGGAGGAGESVVGAVNKAGQGGIGIYSSITGSSVGYAGGGGGGIWQGAREAGAGAAYGGGRGSVDTNSPGSNATANTGGGGGAASGEGASNGLGGNGGSGIIVIAYPDTFRAITTIPGTLTYDQPTRSGYRVYRFTAGTGTITF